MPKARSIVIAVGVTALVNVIVNVVARSGFPLRLGASAPESRVPLPGDELFPDAQCQYDRARTIAAPPSTVWPWIAQLGQNKAGFYSFEMLENLFGCDIHGDDRIHPEWQSVAPGDPFALHPEMGLRVAEVTPNAYWSSPVREAGHRRVRSSMPLGPSSFPLLSCAAVEPAPGSTYASATRRPP